MKFPILFAALALSACAATTPTIVYRDRPIEVQVPVAQPCVAGVRPAAPVALDKQYSADQWATLDTKQKAAVVAHQGLAMRTYGENINGATIGCP